MSIQTYKYIRFLGDYSKLKSMGFAFQKLYASNYMQWCKGTTRVWKKGQEVTHDRLTNFEGAFFELYLQCKKNGEEPPFHKTAYRGKEYLRVYTDRGDWSATFNPDKYRENQHAPIEEYDPKIESVCLVREDLSVLDRFYDLGWVELGVTEKTS